MKRSLAVLAAACLAAGLAVTTPTTAGPAHAATSKVSVRSLLAKLPTRAENRVKYTNASRDRFGYDEGLDADGDGCVTRKEVLIRDAVRLTKKSASCSVAGTWRSLYDARLTKDVYSLEVDHLVAIAEAWHSGANTWSHQRQVAFGNDVAYRWSLQATTRAVNQRKKAYDPAEWMPAKDRCTYIAAWVGVKARWKLTVDPAEKRAISRWLAGCPGLAVLKPGTPTLAALSGIGKPASAPKPAPVVTPVAVPVAVPVAGPVPVPVPVPVVVAGPVTVPVPVAPPAAVSTLLTDAQRVAYQKLLAQSSSTWAAVISPRYTELISSAQVQLAGRETEAAEADRVIAVAVDAYQANYWFAEAAKEQIEINRLNSLLNQLAYNGIYYSSVSEDYQRQRTAATARQNDDVGKQSALDADIRARGGSV